MLINIVVVIAGDVVDVVIDEAVVAIIDDMVGWS